MSVLDPDLYGVGGLLLKVQRLKGTWRRSRPTGAQGDFPSEADGVDLVYRTTSGGPDADWTSPTGGLHVVLIEAKAGLLTPALDTDEHIQLSVWWLVLVLV